jgi:hypothetical protein
MKFVGQARVLHGDKYDYSKVEYVNNKVKVCIVCPTHGEFWQRPDNHLLGKGCRTCGNIITRASRVSTTDKFRNRSVKVHGDKYDYSKVEYVNAHRKVCIICPDHGEFLQEPQHHVKGFGCRACAGSLKKTTEKFISDAKAVHGDKYDYSKVDYKLARIKVCIVCPEHGEFWQTPNNHTSSVQACSSCAEYGFRPYLINYVYVLKAGNYRKVGITNHPLQRIAQLRKNTPFQFEVDKMVEVENARHEETRLHRLYPSAGLTGFDGATEWRITELGR